MMHYVLWISQMHHPHYSHKGLVTKDLNLNLIKSPLSRFVFVVCDFCFYSVSWSSRAACLGRRSRSNVMGSAPVCLVRSSTNHHIRLKRLVSTIQIATVRWALYIPLKSQNSSVEIKFLFCFFLFAFVWVWQLLNKHQAKAGSVSAVYHLVLALCTGVDREIELDKEIDV